MTTMLTKNFFTTVKRRIFCKSIWNFLGNNKSLITASFNYNKTENNFDIIQ